MLMLVWGGVVVAALVKLGRYSSCMVMSPGRLSSLLKTDEG